MSKKRYSKVLVSAIVALNVIFACAILYVFLKTGNEPTVLVGCWFAFTTGELWTISKITQAKAKIKGAKNEESKLDSETIQ